MVRLIEQRSKRPNAFGPFKLAGGLGIANADRRTACDDVLEPDLGRIEFCRLGPTGDVPDPSTFSKNRHGRFRDSDLLRHVFEMVLHRCLEEGLVGGDGFAVDGSLIKS
jgi:hypothetical protein